MKSKIRLILTILFLASIVGLFSAVHVRADDTPPHQDRIHLKTPKDVDAYGRRYLGSLDATARRTECKHLGVSSKSFLEWGLQEEYDISRSIVAFYCHDKEFMTLALKDKRPQVFKRITQSWSVQLLDAHSWTHDLLPVAMEVLELNLDKPNKDQENEILVALFMNANRQEALSALATDAISRKKIQSYIEAYNAKIFVN